MRRISTVILFAMLLSSAMVFMIPVRAQEHEGELVLYSANPTELSDRVKAPFEKKYGITVSVVRGGGAAMLQRISAESANPLGDVFWSTSIITMNSYKKFFMEHSSAETQAAPAVFRDPENRIHPINVHLQTIMYNKGLVKENEKPKGWLDLCDPKYEEKVAYVSPRVVGSAYTQLQVILRAFGKGDVDSPEGWKIVKALMLNAVIQKESSGAYQKVGMGEFPFGMTLEYQAYTWIAGGGNIGIIYPQEGTVADAEGIGIIEGAKHPKAAKLFVDYMLSKEVRTIELKEFYRRPARTDIDVATLVPGLPNVSGLKLIDFDFGAATKDRERLLTKWDDLMTTIPQEQKARSDVAKALSSAEDAIKVAEQAGKTLGIDDAKAKLSQAKDAFKAMDFAKAKQLAEQSAAGAGAAKTWMETYGTTVALVVLLVVVVGAVVFVRMRRKKA
jgi:iron(III) transport system substrate-binding protein